MSRLFGTDGVRGRANDELTAELALRLAAHRMVADKVGSSPVLATAGYNAGPNRARRWQPDDQGIAADQYAESIPLTETRDYVKHVMTNAAHYGILLGQGAQSIGKRMQIIPMRSAQ